MLLPSRDIIKQIISLYAFSVFLALVCLSSFLVRCHCCTIALCGNQRRRPTFPSVDIGQTLHGPAPPSPPHVRGVVLKVDGAVTENEIFNEPVFFALPSATPARGLFFFFAEGHLGLGRNITMLRLLGPRVAPRKQGGYCSKMRQAGAGYSDCEMRLWKTG